jgi:hypothetical protein
VLILLGAALRLTDLGRTSLWVDEIFTMRSMTAFTLGECLEEVGAAQLKMPLDHVLGHI